MGFVLSALSSTFSGDFQDLEVSSGDLNILSGGCYVTVLPNYVLL